MTAISPVRIVDGGKFSNAFPVQFRGFRATVAAQLGSRERAVRWFTDAAGTVYAARGTYLSSEPLFLMPVQAPPGFLDYARPAGDLAGREIVIAGQSAGDLAQTNVQLRTLGLSNSAADVVQAAGVVKEKASAATEKANDFALANRGLLLLAGTAVGILAFVRRS